MLFQSPKQHFLLSNPVVPEAVPVTQQHCNLSAFEYLTAICWPRWALFQDHLFYTRSPLLLQLNLKLINSAGATKRCQKPLSSPFHCCLLKTRIAFTVLSRCYSCNLSRTGLPPPQIQHCHSNHCSCCTCADWLLFALRDAFPAQKGIKDLWTIFNSEDTL